MVEKKVRIKTREPEAPPVRVFNVGDLAVYPAHGVAIIEAIESRVINGEKHDFYILKVLENSMVIMVPTSNVDSVGLRDVISEEDVPKIFDVMRNKKEMAFETQTWNRRYREYMDKIKTGSLYDVAEVFRDLFILKLTKDLSFGERKLFDTATTLLLKELSTAKNTDEKTIMEEIESLFDIPEVKSSELNFSDEDSADSDDDDDGGGNDDGGGGNDDDDSGDGNDLVV